MPNYKKMYLELLNNMTTAITTLQAAQKLTEESYMNTHDGDFDPTHDTAEEANGHD